MTLASQKVQSSQSFAAMRSKQWLDDFLKLPTKHAAQVSKKIRFFSGHKLWLNPIFRYAMIYLAIALAVLCITIPFSHFEQFLFLLSLWGIALWLRQLPGKTATLVMITLSVMVSSRYIWWRVTSTLNWDDMIDLFLGFGLLAAEFYAYIILMLGYFQTAWPLKRTPAMMPSDVSGWPSVDIYIPTYNEPLNVVRPTVFAAIGLDWPKDKINIVILDDGKRPEFKVFAEQFGVGYLTRPDNSHAKAGNLNHALGKTDGEFITIFDCDHIPTRSFLQVAMGWFIRDKNLALVQTPHHFFSPDPFERNLKKFRDVPNEGELFYGLIQDGNDLWNASFFCGSCAILRRGPLLEIGGIAVETVTEDAHTALKLHAKGYNSAYLNLPQAAGLATESLSAHIGQRIRWARGMA
ncbi:MAG: glycosyltransferase, partial [Psychrosphaera sp.]|nr:glycosyltransferase [Psychrosphaera sp.]